jgi:hypothetical protein
VLRVEGIEVGAKGVVETADVAVGLEVVPGGAACFLLAGFEYHEEGIKAVSDGVSLLILQRELGFIAGPRG